MSPGSISPCISKRTHNTTLREHAALIRNVGVVTAQGTEANQFIPVEQRGSSVSPPHGAIADVTVLTGVQEESRVNGEYGWRRAAKTGR